jgi:replicative DNA helicase
MRRSAPVHHLKRQAKLLARTDKIPLHEAQDRVAREQGFATWSLLAARRARAAPEVTLLPRLSAGDMLLIGARPGQGKTMLGLRLLREAVSDGRRAVFFTLDYSQREAMERMAMLTEGAAGALPEIVTSDEISADYIMRYLADAPRGSVAVIDYLQILDQQRHKPDISQQLSELHGFARRTGVILGFISQIDRSFAPERDVLPRLSDIRRPNPIPVEVFSKMCFLHAGEMRFS